MPMDFIGVKLPAVPVTFPVIWSLKFKWTTKGSPRSSSKCVNFIPFDFNNF